MLHLPWLGFPRRFDPFYKINAASSGRGRYIKNKAFGFGVLGSGLSEMQMFVGIPTSDFFGWWVA